MLLLATTAAQAVADAIPVSDPGISSWVESLSHQAGLAGITVWILQGLKRSTFFPWISANTNRINQVVSTLAALFSALAIQISVTGGDLGTGFHGTWAIPSAHILWDSIVRFVGSKIGQDALYKIVYDKPLEVTPVAPPPMDFQGKPLPDPVKV